ncbi:MAG TPA: sugar nucleotide-binding protein [Verrucomicrobiae bacterium]|nr:sugar nucleotide-binding protein [Verrucomicrobiae bacterium]
MVVVVGAGFVGTAIARGLASAGRRYELLSRAGVDYCDPGKLERWLDAHPARVMLNASGWNGRNVDDVQRNAEKSREANVALPESLARVCASRGVAFAHLSTGCVFHGRGPFAEGDAPNFLRTVYARHKLEAEGRIRDIGDAWIFRIRLAFSGGDHPRNLLSKLRDYRRILPGRQSATWLEDFSTRWLRVVEGAPAGIYHAVQPVPIEIVAAARALGNHAPLWEEASFLREGHVPRSECELATAKYEAASGGHVPDGPTAVTVCVRELLRCGGR